MNFALAFEVEALHTRTMKALRNPNFRNVLVGHAISSLGDGFHTIAALWWIKVQTGSDGMVAAVAFAKGLTAVGLAPFAGALVDRFDRRKVMLFSDCSRALVVTILGFLALTNLLEPWALIVASVLLSALGVLFNPAYSSSIPNIVGKENLGEATANLQVSATLAQILGPALGGLTVSQLGVGGAFLVDAGSFLLSAVFILFSQIKTPEVVTNTKNSSLLTDMKEAWLWLRGQRIMFSIICLATGLNL